MTREQIKPLVENFMSEHNEEELIIAIRLGSDNGKSIANFHVDSDGREVIEESTRSELIISNYNSSIVTTIPDDVPIPYEEVVKCEIVNRIGEYEDVIAVVMEITFNNGTQLELGFLCL